MGALDLKQIAVDTYKRNRQHFLEICDKHATNIKVKWLIWSLTPQIMKKRKVFLKNENTWNK